MSGNAYICDECGTTERADHAENQSRTWIATSSRSVWRTFGRRGFYEQDFLFCSLSCLIGKARKELGT